MRVLITGAGGFVGRALLVNLVDKGQHEVLAQTRQIATKPVAGAMYLPVGDLANQIHQDSARDRVHSVVHLAGRAHVLKDLSVDPLAEFRLANVVGTLRLAKKAAAMGVQRFVYVSSIGVNGSQTAIGKPFSESDNPNPHTAYAVSKWEAEEGLLQIAAKTGLEVVIIRPPLVYGPNAPGNFGSLLRAVKGGWPLPLGTVHNQRSLVALDNLVDFIITCIDHPQAANQTFLISDGEDLSTTELVRRMAQAAGVPARLIPVPVWALQAVGRMLGKGDAVQRLSGDLQIDSGKARKILAWEPKISVQEGLRRAFAGSVLA
jgi:nucleoside-diphosphate-sugar epimerase